MTTYARQAEALKISDEQALEGFFYFVSVREEKASKYPDYVTARKEASTSLQQLATMERAFGSARVREWLREAVEKAEEKLQGAA